MASPVMELASGDVIFKQATVKGFWGSKVSGAMAPERRAALIGELVARVADGTITLPVEETFPFERIADAARANGEPGRVGKVLLRP
jgi:NADPH2:quinone reductase